MKSDKYKKPLTVRQQAAILRLYVQLHLPPTTTARRLRLSADLVARFLRKRGVLRHRGYPAGTPIKISLADRQNLESELATTRDVVLARKYGFSRERIRQIRRQLGYPSSQILRRVSGARARAKRREQEKLAVELRRQQRRARQLPAVNRLSKRWKSGMAVAELAQEFGFTVHSMYTRISVLRKQFPEKFPYRVMSHSHH